VKVDGLALYEHQRLFDLFENHLLMQKEPLRCITCDAAGFGRDRCVIMVWVGYECVAGVVLSTSDNREIYDAIEVQRKAWRVAVSDTVVDQDGVGGGVVKLGGYSGFMNDAPALPDPDTQVKENYKNLKTQCYYRFAVLVNSASVRFTVTNDNWLIDGKRTSRLKVSGQVVTVADMVRTDLKAIKRAKPDSEGKLLINSKEEHKIILGRSPDFGDGAMMRCYFDVRPRAAKPWFIRRAN
jgi:phage terminase large subunit